MARKTSIYNNVSVTVKNQNTGNHCVSVDQIANGKSFNFLIDGEHYVLNPRQVMDYIANNRCKVFKHVDGYDEATGMHRSYCFGFYLISDEYIISNAA